MPRPPASTLFPYTTLFRSLLGDSLVRAQTVTPDLFSPARDAFVVSPDSPLRRIGDSGNPVNDGRDRKSTHLNSSHANISYAVFCLKKKSSFERRPRRVRR